MSYELPPISWAGNAGSRDGELFKGVLQETGSGKCG